MKTKVIIPCAGYGTRIGMLPSESKELLWDKQKKQYVIDYSLKLCNVLGFEPLVINRFEKTDLTDYLNNSKSFIEYILVDKSEEWYDSILKSYDRWNDNNIVILPDTRWDNNLVSLKHIKFCLEELNSPMALGLLKVEEAKKWCVLNGDYLFEKPSNNVGNLAVGVFGFYKETGKELFEAFKEKKSFKIPKATQFVELKNFQDITRQKSDRLVKV